MRTAIALLLLTATVTPAADPPKTKLAELVRLYQAYDLPAPPKDAKLYRYDPKGGKSSPAIGFGLKPDRDGIPTEFQHGFEISKFDTDYHTEIRPDAKRVTVEEIEFVMIVQFHLRGWTALAEELLPKWEDQGRTPEQALARAAWDYWLVRLRDPKVDRALVVRRMASAMRAEPDMFADEYHEPTYVDLRKSLLPSRAKPGTPEALIDDWLDMAGYFNDQVPGERYEAVVRLGFDAVPALIDALDDTRLTRAYGTLDFGHHEYPHRIKDFAHGILCGFMYDGERFADLKEGGLDMKAVKKWWASVSKANEEEYVVGRVLRPAKDHPLPNLRLLAVVRHKYPKRLPALFREAMTDHPDHYLSSVAQAVVASSLPTETKRELLLEAVGSKTPSHRGVGRGCLRDVDPERFHRIVIDALGKLPATPSKPYHDCEETAFVNDLLMTSVWKVWEAAEKYLRRADAGMREQWLHMLSWYTPPERKRQAVELVAKFLTDTTVRDSSVRPELYPPWHAERPEYRTVEVRNCAAAALGQMLKLKPQPNPKWSADEWAKFREEVAKAVKEAK